MRRHYIKSGIFLFVPIFALIIGTVSLAQNEGQRTRPARTSRQRAKDRNFVPDFQRDPVRLVKEFYLDETTSKSVFNLALTVENSLEAGAWEKLDEKQRTAVTKAFESMVKEVLEEWDPETVGHVRVLKNEIRGNRAVVTVLRELELIRFSLVSRNGVWFIIEHEVADDALPEFTDAIRDALYPGTGRGRVYDMAGESALKYVDDLTVKKGESPQLLLLKYRLLVSKQLEEDQVMSAESLRFLKNGKTQGNETQPKTQQQALLENDRALDLLMQITTRWPDFAPGHLALAFDLLYFGNDDAVLSSTSKDAERAMMPLLRYIELVPFDPRPWRDLAHAHMLLEKNSEAESAFRSAIERDPSFLDHYAGLVIFLLSLDELEKARSDFKRMLQVATTPDEAFDGLYDEGGYDPDYAKTLQSLLLSFPKELAASKSGLVLLANAEEAQNKPAEAVKTMQRAVAINAEADDYEYLSQLYRQQRRFTEALNAANLALKSDSKFAMAFFERACSLTQLGRKREALAALKQMMALDPEALFDPDDLDLQPLANLPEFKALKEKMKEAVTVTDEAKSEDERKEKARKSRSGKP
jgi:tetratricopeptide (TPR) repeat protein